jgi:hypothetical protein
MYDRSRLTRLITLALASCSVTWALAAAAQARPDSSPPSTAAIAAPAFKAVAGDTNKAPSATAAPAFKPVAGDTAKTPDPRQVERVLNGVGRGKTPGQPAVAGNNDDTGTIALVVAIVAMLTALAAMTLIAMRQTRPAMRA